MKSAAPITTFSDIGGASDGWDHRAREQAVSLRQPPGRAPKARILTQTTEGTSSCYIVPRH
jgi:hypothetical protein